MVTPLLRRYLDLITFSPYANSVDSEHKRNAAEKLLGLPEDITTVHLLNTRDIDFCVLCHAVNNRELAEYFLEQEYGSPNMSVLVGSTEPQESTDSALWSASLGFNRRGALKSVIKTRTVTFVPEAVPWLCSLKVQKVRQLITASNTPKVNKIKEATLRKNGVQSNA